jgi:hypothetical protein
LHKHLQSLGLKVEEQIFYVHGDKRPYRNILGYLGNTNKKFKVIGAHYDTVENSPGANDNLTAVAVSLELARLLSQHPLEKRICFAFFTLEEGHPGYFIEKHNLLKENHYMDGEGNFKDIDMFEFSKKVDKYLKGRDKSLPYYKSLEEYINRNTLQEYHEKFLKLKIQVDKKYTDLSPLCRPSYTVGSYEFVKAFAKSIEHAYIFDCLGWIKSTPYSQKPLPLPKEANRFLKNHLIQVNQSIGDFLTIIADINSHVLLDRFQELINHDSREIPNMSIHLPVGYERIKNNVR